VVILATGSLKVFVAKHHSWVVSECQLFSLMPNR